MQLTIDIDFNQLLQDTVNSEQLKNRVSKAMEEAIVNAITDNIGYSSPFRKKIAEQIAELLPHGLDKSDITKYQQVLNDLMLASVNSINSDTLRTALEKSHQLLIENTPPTIKLSELLEVIDADQTLCRAELELSEKQYAHLYLFNNELMSYSHKYQAEIQIHCNGDGEVYSLKMDDEFITPGKPVTVITRADTLLMALYTNRTKLIIDMDADDVEYFPQCDNDD